MYRRIKQTDLQTDARDYYCLEACIGALNKQIYKQTHVITAV
jgi:hypothetical protein